MRPYRRDYQTTSGRFVFILGFHPINWYVWNRHTGTRPWTPEECGSMSLLRARFLILWTHRRFAR